jgi:LPXTG-site transpeptidase (sortase) family protein
MNVKFIYILFASLFSLFSFFGSFVGNLNLTNDDGYLDIFSNSAVVEKEDPPKIDPEYVITTENPNSSPQPERQIVYEDRRNELLIPSLGINSPLVFPHSASDSVINEYLIDGVAHYPGTAEIGTTGNAFIFGHSSNYPWIQSDYNKIFATLPRIKDGDEVIVVRDGVEYVYRVFSSFEVGPNDTWVLGSNPGDWSTQKELLSLMTCVPVGTNERRLIVWAELIN